MIEVGKISKQWTGFVREAFTDADNFGTTFPMDLDVKMKAVLLGAVFLIVIYLKVVDNFLQTRVNLFLWQDFMYYEQTNSGQNNRR